MRASLAVLALLLLTGCFSQPFLAAPHGIKTDLSEPSECLNGEVLELGRCVPQGTEKSSPDGATSNSSSSSGSSSDGM